MCFNAAMFIVLLVSKGSIPVVERNAGMDRMLSHLPVLIIDNYSQLTPQLLLDMYPCFIANTNKWRFQHLTVRYWVMLVRTAKATANIDHVAEQHPETHICDYRNYLK